MKHNEYTVCLYLQDDIRPDAQADVGRRKKERERERGGTRTEERGRGRACARARERARARESARGTRTHGAEACVDKIHVSKGEMTLSGILWEGLVS